MNEDSAPKSIALSFDRLTLGQALCREAQSTTIIVGQLPVFLMQLISRLPCLMRYRGLCPDSSVSEPTSTVYPRRFSRRDFV